MSSFPLIRQHDSMECGVACLAMVCKFFRIEYSIEYLSRICFATTEGVSLLGINETALQLGLRTISGRISINKLWEAHYPCILHWNQNHFVVLYKDKKGNTFYIADPAKGLVKYYLEEFKKHWVSTQSGGEEKGIAMFLEPTPAFYEKKMDEEPKEERSFNMQVLCKQNIYENCRDKEKKVEKISNPLISDDHFLQIKVISIYANYKVEYFLMLRNIVFMQKNLRTVFVLHIFVANY